LSGARRVTLVRMDAQQCTTEDREFFEAPAEDRLLTIGEVAARISLSPRAVWQRIESGELRSVKIGRARRIAASELRRWIASLPTNAGAGQ
jgi:excisionase family DNA binding protein